MGVKNPREGQGKSRSDEAAEEASFERRATNYFKREDAK